MNLLHEEEERIAKQADGLQRRSSQMKFNYVNTSRCKNNVATAAMTAENEEEQLSQQQQQAEGEEQQLQQQSEEEES